jgi:hypothetical protein
MDDKDELIKELREKLSEIEEELDATKEHLKKYTAPSRNRQYYYRNKDVLQERSRIYKKTTKYKSTPEQVKEYARRAYLKKKEKLKKELEEKQNSENI